MARRRSSLGLFGIFGRSEDLRQLDRAMRAVDLHPSLVPEAVKLTVVNLLKDDMIGEDPAPQAYRAAAELLAYCMIGAEGFAGANNVPLTLRVEERIEAALKTGDTPDARIILLTLAAKIVQPSVVERFALTSHSD